MTYRASRARIDHTSQLAMGIAPRVFWLALAGTVALGCGARSSLLELEALSPGAGGSGGAGGHGGAGGQVSTGGHGGAGGSGGALICAEGMTEPCGSDVGACKPGTQTCHDNMFGMCEGAIGPSQEICNGIDDNCNGQVDEGFNLGAPCDGPDGDFCLDDKITCNGCSEGADNIEICNGIDDNCNGVIDADCVSGDCQPKLIVTGSTPSSPNCVDFPVKAGSTGIIEYPCSGGPVKAMLGDITFTGGVMNGVVSLVGTQIIPPWEGPDGCTWQDTHRIDGTIAQGTLTYSYSEMVIAKPPGVQCWFPCTETGVVDVNWMMAPAP
jgi:hypothetical protein